MSLAAAKPASIAARFAASVCDLRSDFCAAACRAVRGSPISAPASPSAIMFGQAPAMPLASAFIVTGQ